jgi:predicted ABC-type ATPase
VPDVPREAPDEASTGGAIFVLAGCNGAGKSSIGGAALRASGIAFFNPDDAARRIATVNASRVPPLTQADINGAAWDQGRRLLQRAIDEHGGLAFETTLGGQTMTELLEQAANAGMAVHVWFAGLTDVDQHIERVRRRVARGGHDIPEARIRERFDRGRVNLIRLLPVLRGLHLYDNSIEADPALHATPRPRLLLHCCRQRIVVPDTLRRLRDDTPHWAVPIVAAALKLHMRHRAADSGPRTSTASMRRTP